MGSPRISEFALTVQYHNTHEIRFFDSVQDADKAVRDIVRPDIVSAVISKATDHPRISVVLEEYEPCPVGDGQNYLFVKVWY